MNPYSLSARRALFDSRIRSIIRSSYGFRQAPKIAANEASDPYDEDETVVAKPATIRAPPIAAKNLSTSAGTENVKPSNNGAAARSRAPPTLASTGPKTASPAAPLPPPSARGGIKQITALNPPAVVYIASSPKKPSVSAKKTTGVGASKASPKVGLPLPDEAPEQQTFKARRESWQRRGSGH